VRRRSSGVKSAVRVKNLAACCEVVSELTPTRSKCYTTSLDVLVYAAATAFSLPIAVLLSLTIGFLFGRWLGTLVVVCAATSGATILFVAARYLFADAARRRMGSVGEKINAGFTENGFLYLLFLRLVPLFPFFLVNLAPAFTTIRVSTFVVATAIGIIPGTFVFVNLGQALASIETLSGLLSPQLAGSLALLALLVRLRPQAR